MNAFDATDYVDSIRRAAFTRNCFLYGRDSAQRMSMRDALHYPPAVGNEPPLTISEFLDVLGDLG